METRTYQPESGLGKNKQNLENFGQRQNDLNAQVQAQLTEILQKLDELKRRLDAAEQEQQQNMNRFAGCAAELKDIHKDIDQLRLTAKLNSNAIDRMMKKK